MTIFADYNPEGTTRTTKSGKPRHIPLLPNHFNHLWFQAYADDFIEKNILENNGVVSGCVISQDGANDAINCTAGEIYINDTKVIVTAPATFDCTIDGWYSAYINDAGVIIYGLLENNTVQSADTPSDAVIIGFALRGNGVFTIYSYFNKVKDQVLIVNNQNDYVLGSSSQLSSGAATIKWNGTNYVDRDDTIITIPDYADIAIVGSDTLTANMPIPTVIGLKMKSINGAQLQLGVNAADGNAPFKLISDNTTKYHDIDIMTDKPFEDLDFALTDDRKRYYANQGLRNKVVINGDVIYDPSNAGNVIFKDSFPSNPYLVRMNGGQHHFQLHATPANNNTLAWFRDLNKFLHGYRDGAEVASRFTLPTIIGASPHLFQVNTANGMLRDISKVDPDIDSRTDSNGVSIPATVDVTIGSSIVTFQSSIGDSKNFQRISGLSAEGIPDGASGTTILMNISGLTATMVDALTLSPVNATATNTGVSATIDNSGAAGGSLQEDAGQRLKGHLGSTSGSPQPGGSYLDVDDALLASGVFTKSATTSDGQRGTDDSLYNTNQFLFDSANSLSPNPAKTSDEVTRDNTTSGYILYQA